jgi:hypothetical protein
MQRAVSASMMAIGSWFAEDAPSISAKNIRFLPYVPEGKIAELRTGRRIRLDIMPTDRTRDEEVERLLAVGAVEYEDHQPDGTGWVTMANPEGNLFCAERGATERV